MWKSILFLASLTLSLFQTINAQDSFPKFSKEITVSKYVEKEFMATSIYSSFLERSCYKGIAILRFKVDTLSKITDILFEESILNRDSIPDFLKAKLTEILISTNGYWTPQIYKNKKVLSNYFEMTVFYKLGNKCRSREKEAKWELIDINLSFPNSIHLCPANLIVPKTNDRNTSIVCYH